MSRVKVLPDDVKQNCLSLVRGYDRRREAYRLAREEILSNTPDNVYTIRDKENPDNEYKQIGVLIPGSHHVSRTTEDVTLRLEGLEMLTETRRMRAVEYAAGKIGRDLPEEQRKILVKAILTSCIQGRRFPFERLQVEGMERSCFYDRRMKFLIDIAKYMDLIESADCAAL